MELIGVNKENSCELYTEFLSIRYVKENPHEKLLFGHDASHFLIHSFAAVYEPSDMDFEGAIRELLTESNEEIAERERTLMAPIVKAIEQEMAVQEQIRAKLAAEWTSKTRDELQKSNDRLGALSRQRLRATVPLWAVMKMIKRKCSNYVKDTFPNLSFGEKEVLTKMTACTVFLFKFGAIQHLPKCSQLEQIQAFLSSRTTNTVQRCCRFNSVTDPDNNNNTYKRLQ